MAHEATTRGLIGLLGRLPRGRTLDDRLWQMRHRGMLLLLCAHVPALAAFAIARGSGPYTSRPSCCPSWPWPCSAPFRG